MRVALENLNKFLSLAVRRINKDMWHTFPERTKKIFYNNKDIHKWIAKDRDLTQKMIFAMDIGFDSAIVVFPNNNCSVADIPELSEYYFKIENKIAATDKQLEKMHFAICVRELGVSYYNMSQNSNGSYFGRREDFKALQEATDFHNKNKKYESATEASKSAEIRENILSFVLNLLIDLNGKHGDLSLEQITILSHLRRHNETGVKFDTVITIFKGSLGKRRIQQYLTILLDKGYINRTGKKENTIYMLSAKGMFFVNDWADRIMSL